jgi:XTP/dITP diphosphohydrolase
MQIVLATNNSGKFQELSQLLKVEGVEYVSNYLEIEETGKTFVENAVLKATATAKETGLPAIADDSGLEIYALGGFPGLHSARCAGDGASDEAKTYYVLGKMDGVKDRKARFVSVIAFVRPEAPQIPTFFTGYCEGKITREPRGKASPGLQYDSIFYYPPFRKTLAEVSKEEKNTVSHRFKASQGMQFYLKSVVQNGRFSST